MPEHLAQPVILEKTSRIGLRCSPSFTSGWYSPGASFTTACPQRITPLAASKA